MNVSHAFVPDVTQEIAFSGGPLPIGGKQKAWEKRGRSPVPKEPEGVEVPESPRAQSAPVCW
ncbi:MAG TPA: hypothetical protein VEL31_03275 [Ktedonobacteraceae bacterium]|jgi:hypothetical protein|nr:hypothetical protein [Ktedonobacteraceae bacterium]